MSFVVAPEVGELLSDEQLLAVEAQVATGEAPCIHCGETIDPEISDATVILIVDPASRRAAVRVSHGACGDSIVTEAELPGPADARLAERWAAFELPGLAFAVLQSDAGVWTGEERPALVEMLTDLGFDGAREAFDSDLFATGVGAPPVAAGVELVAAGEEIDIRLSSGDVLETLPGLAVGRWIELAGERGGALIAIGPTLGIPSEGGVGFEELLPAMLERAVAAFVPLA